ncbi:hypothetical protein QYE76_020626 [Lolium multiflorum]|uniref:Uncharacterized protein n=1 Tax=Lolium multiflorum TaxID=4521 RepID=A0AAD8VQ70_LOLMU|nr:hypothetical protein QYE76_020626 [Lolium multiflorum]
MIHPKKLAQLAKKWQRKVSVGAGGQQADECCSTVADKGHCVVYTAEGARFEVPLAYLATTVFGELLRMSGEEFGFTSSEGGRITLPCDAAVMEYVLCLVETVEAAEEAVAAKKEARARAKVEAQPACIDDDKDTKDYSSEGDTSSSDASNATTSSEEVTSRKRLREDDETGPSKKK